MRILTLILILSLGLNTFAQIKGIKFINDTLLSTYKNWHLYIRYLIC